jgi:Rrf2 family transcriptional regulator, iron-sulfur cluster assembly transcription factor
MLTRSGVHAIRALVVLASQRPGEYCGTSAIAALTEAPRNYLGKILLTLSRRGLVESQKGLGGGFRLSRSPEKISLYDVVESIEDVARWKECAFGGKACSDDSPCVIHTRWGHVRDAYLSLLKNTSVAELVVSSALVNAPNDDPAPLASLVASNPQRRLQ